jgi:glucoside 3-dehydrogenase (cytochrome c) hitch-hiker subunit
LEDNRALQEFQTAGFAMSEEKRGINRRELLRRLAAGAGASATLPMIGHAAPPSTETGSGKSMPGMDSESGESLGAALPPDPELSSPDWKPKFFDAHQNETVVTVSDLLIPDTDTPGAKAAQANRFIDLLLAGGEEEEKRNYVEALNWLDGHCLGLYGKPFTDLARSQQEDVLTLLTHKNSNPEIAYGVEMFGRIKGSIVDAYYSSKIGLVQELKYQTDPFQTSFPGCSNPGEHS